MNKVSQTTFGDTKTKDKILRPTICHDAGSLSRCVLSINSNEATKTKTAPCGDYSSIKLLGWHSSREYCFRVISARKRKWPATGTSLIIGGNLAVEVVRPQGTISRRSCRHSVSDPQRRCSSTTHRTGRHTLGVSIYVHLGVVGLTNRRCVWKLQSVAAVVLVRLSQPSWLLGDYVSEGRFGEAASDG